MTFKNAFARVLVLGVITSCTAAHVSDSDVSVPDATAQDATARDASSLDAAPMANDSAPTFDAGVSIDAATDDATSIGDASVTCTAAATCGARSCGRSDCGASCGECSAGFYCNGSGTCVDRAVTPPGTACIDAFLTEVVEGSPGFRVCADDPDLLQRCLCSGGGPSAWVACDPCVDVRLDGARGARCVTEAQCADPVPCHPSLRLCGESCDRGLPAACVPGTVCGIPGDIAGVCLPACASCGTGCDDSSTCRRAEGGNVCVPDGYGWATSC